MGRGVAPGRLCESSLVVACGTLPPPLRTRVHTPARTDACADSYSTLPRPPPSPHPFRTLEHVESISSDVSVLARDSGVQRNLKTLVQALSRLLDE